MKRLHRFYELLLICCLLAIGMAGCTTGENEAAKAIEAYIHALSDKDSTQVSNLSCADWEQEALVEVDSLTAVGTSIKDLSCQQTGEDGEDILVSCTGVLALDYNGEAQQIDLSAHNFIARQEGGEWRMCGYR